MFIHSKTVGLIPNSIVRKQVGYIPPSEDFHQLVHRILNRENTCEVVSHQSRDESIAGGMPSAGSLKNEDSLNMFREDLSSNDSLKNLEGAENSVEKATSPDTEEEEEGREEELEDTRGTGTLMEVMKKPPHTPLQQYQQQHQSADSRDVDSVELVEPTSDPHRDKNDSSKMAQLRPQHVSKSTAKPTMPGMEEITGTRLIRPCTLVHRVSILNSH